MLRRGIPWMFVAFLAVSAASADETRMVPARLRPGDPSGSIPGIRATVIGLRFFESPQSPKKRHYDDLFFYNAARYIYWELNLTHPAPGRAIPFTVEDIWHAPGGRVVYRGTHAFTIQADWTYSAFYSGARLAGTKTVTTDKTM